VSRIAESAWCLGYGLGAWGILVPFPAGVNFYLFFETSRPVWNLPSLPFNGYQRVFPRWWSGRVVKWKAHSLCHRNTSTDNCTFQLYDSFLKRVESLRLTWYPVNASRWSTQRPQTPSLSLRVSVSESKSGVRDARKTRSDKLRHLFVPLCGKRAACCMSSRPSWFKVVLEGGWDQQGVSLQNCVCPCCMGH
jgi:hypothetical protein